MRECLIHSNPRRMRRRGRGHSPRCRFLPPRSHQLRVPPHLLGLIVQGVEVQPNDLSGGGVQQPDS